MDGSHVDTVDRSKITYNRPEHGSLLRWEVRLTLQDETDNNPDETDNNPGKFQHPGAHRLQICTLYVSVTPSCGSQCVHLRVCHMRSCVLRATGLEIGDDIDKRRHQRHGNSPMTHTPAHDAIVRSNARPSACLCNRLQ